jgi:uncharacterized protein YecE (DUF72 family)
MKTGSLPQPIRVGPSGWEYPETLAAGLPPRRSRFRHPLEPLASLFDTVEITSTFERPLRPEIARLYVALVSSNPRFSFTVLLGKRFTRERCLDPAETDEFKAGLRPLYAAGRLGNLVATFPWAFRFTAENREFLIRLRRTFAPLPLAVEMQHESWLADEALGTLIDYRIGFVNLDQPPRTGAMPPQAIVTFGAASFRLHGRDPEYWNRQFSGQPGWNNYLYSTDELEQWAARILRAAANAAGAYVTLANPASGGAIRNALQLADLLTNTDFSPKRAVA